MRGGLSVGGEKEKGSSFRFQESLREGGGERSFSSNQRRKRKDRTHHQSFNSWQHSHEKRRGNHGGLYVAEKEKRRPV